MYVFVGFRLFCFSFSFISFHLSLWTPFHTHTHTFLCSHFFVQPFQNWHTTTTVKSCAYPLHNLDILDFLFTPNYGSSEIRPPSSSFHTPIWFYECTHVWFEINLMSEKKTFAPFHDSYTHAHKMNHVDDTQNNVTHTHTHTIVENQLNWTDKH